MSDQPNLDDGTKAILLLLARLYRAAIGWGCGCLMERPRLCKACHRRLQDRAAECREIVIAAVLADVGADAPTIQEGQP